MTGNGQEAEPCANGIQYRGLTLYLLYEHDTKIPSTLDFYKPKPPAETLESEYGRKLFWELKKMRNLAWQSCRIYIKKALNSQKRQMS